MIEHFASIISLKLTVYDRINFREIINVSVFY
jgi:hypothetical protein